MSKNILAVLASVHPPMGVLEKKLMPGLCKPSWYRTGKSTTHHPIQLSFLGEISDTCSSR